MGWMPHDRLFVLHKIYANREERCKMAEEMVGTGTGRGGEEEDYSKHCMEYMTLWKWQLNSRVTTTGSVWNVVLYEIDDN